MSWELLTEFKDIAEFKQLGDFQSAVICGML